MWEAWWGRRSREPPPAEAAAAREGGDGGVGRAAPVRSGGRRRVGRGESGAAGGAVAWGAEHAYPIQHHAEKCKTPEATQAAPKGGLSVAMAVLEEVMEEGGLLMMPPQQIERVDGALGEGMNQEQVKLSLLSLQMEMEEIQHPVLPEVMEEEVVGSDQLLEERLGLEAEFLVGIVDQNLALDPKKRMFGGVMFISLSLPMDLSPTSDKARGSSSGSGNFVVGLEQVDQGMAKLLDGQAAEAQRSPEFASSKPYPYATSRNHAAPSPPIPHRELLLPLGPFPPSGASPPPLPSPRQRRSFSAAPSPPIWSLS
uniref:Uncharacterized protein n=1 Tax=Oryza glumipatula TaxID=40148 RepID=A0A0D9ZGJ2_9ORYZ